MSETVEKAGGGDGGEGSQENQPLRQALQDNGVPTDENESLHHNSETERLLDIFPEEIWRKVVEQLDDPNDLENASNAVPFFRDILLPRRKEFLFQKVWPLLATHMEYDQYLMRCEHFEEGLQKVLRYSGEVEIIPPWDDPLHLDFDLDLGDEEEENEGEEEPLPLPAPNRWHHDIFSYRLVCKSWCNGIDHFYQHHPRHFQMGEDPKCDVVLTSCWTDFEQFQHYNLRWTGNHSAEKFIRHFGPTHFTPAGNGRNPFISRKVSVLLDLQNFESFQSLRNFVGMYGEHIWYLDLHLNIWRTVPAKRLLKFLQRLFPHLGNLKVLKIFSQDGEKLSRQAPPRIKLPTLKNLQFLSLRYLRSSVSTPLISSNPHISMLEMSNHIGDFGVIGTTPLPNLKKISASVGMDFEIFNDPQPVPWMLEKVHLDFGFLGEGYSAWAKALSMVENKWAETLTDVQLRMPTESDCDVSLFPMSDDLLHKCDSLRLCLPNVTRFRVALTSFCSLDFILPMKDTLEYLDVDVFFEYRCSKLAMEVEKKQVIQFLGYTNRLLESNIWTIFGKLKQFRIFDHDVSVEPAWSFTRKDWELKMRKEEKEQETVYSFLAGIAHRVLTLFRCGSGE